MAGTYVAQLIVVNEYGESSLPCEATLVAVPTDNLLIEMYWVSEDDDAEDDMDLHLLAPGGSPYTPPTDCYWSSCRGGLDWGIPGVVEDNPFLDLDVFKAGPETIRIDKPADGIYTVVVHDFHGSPSEYYAESAVTVNIYLYGELAWTDTRVIMGEDSYEYFATIDTETDEITGL
jgi:hypothetical protein